MLKKLAIKIGTGFITALLTLTFFVGIRYALAQDSSPAVDCTQFVSEEICSAIGACEWNDSTCIQKPEETSAPVITTASEEPAKVQKISIDPSIIESAEWEVNSLQTFGTKFLIRGKEALTWTLNIKDAGFHNEAIQTSYAKVLTIVNSMFILGLLAIAGMWMFSILIPRRYLRQVIFVFAGAVIFVNFAMPLNRLLIDGTNILQRTLLMQDGEKITITNIVETPSYDNATGYKTTAGKTGKEIDVTLTPNPASGNIEVGKLDTSGEPATETSPATESTETTFTIDSEQKLSITEKHEFAPNSEQIIFSFLLIMATGIAYFILAIIFVLRIVILWALLILSPALFLLAIFKSTRGWFWNWLSIYGKWLLIGPLTALGISVIVNIWQSVGIPIVNGAGAVESFGTGLSNISFYLPGSATANTLSNTNEMMQYLVFLMMLYLPIFFAFALTRQKMLQGAVTTVVERLSGPRKTITPQPAPAGEKTTEKLGMIGTLKDMFSSKITKITETALPSAMRTAEEGMTKTIVPSAANFLPEELALTGMHDMLGLLGPVNESRLSRDIVMDKLAFSDSISDPTEKKKFSAVRNEIESRAGRGDTESMVLMNEITEKQSGMQNVPELTKFVPAEVPVMESAPVFVETKVEVTAPITQEKEPEKKEKEETETPTGVETRDLASPDNKEDENETVEAGTTPSQNEEKKDEMKEDEEYKIQ